MNDINLINLDTVDSTSSYLAALAAEGAPHGTVVITREQTAGRGQRGNTWEAEPGKNITMSLLLRAPFLPPVPAARQFALSEHVAMAVADTLSCFITGPSELSVKWPNDIYVCNRKIAGILIECALTGNTIGSMIVGLGLNVNQTIFRSDAPNPVSLAQLTGKRYELLPLITEIARAILSLPVPQDGSYPFPSLHRRYMSALWRRSGLHPYLDKETGRRFLAAIDEVEPDGHLRLRHPDATVTRHPFRTLTQLLA